MFVLCARAVKKKKKKKKTTEGGDAENEGGEAGDGATAADSQYACYSYKELLDRVVGILQEKNPELGEKRRHTMKPPQLMRGAPARLTRARAFTARRNRFMVCRDTEPLRFGKPFSRDGHYAALYREWLDRFQIDLFSVRARSFGPVPFGSSR